MKKKTEGKNGRRMETKMQRKANALPRGLLSYFEKLIFVKMNLVRLDEGKKKERKKEKSNFEFRSN